MEKIHFGRKYIRLSKPIAVRIDVRSIVVSLILCGVLVVALLFALMFGTLQLSVIEVVQALIGNKTGMTRTVVIEWRLPRVLAAIVFGGSLAVSGAIFQSLTRNPLGSPDIIGFTTGSYTGALLSMLMIGTTSFIKIATGALLGGFVTASFIYMLAFKGGTQGFRLIIVGIAISALLGSVNSLLLLKSKAEVALTAAAWGVGSLNGVTWEQVTFAMALALLLLLFSWTMNRPLTMMELGKDASQSLGIRMERTQIILIGLAVALTAVPTAVMGPVAFVALSAPQIANRLTKTTARLIPVALTGATLLLCADIIAQHMLLDKILPVGVITLSLGGIYLVALLFKQARIRIS